MAADADRLEALLADALAAHDQGGEAALAAFVAAHPNDRKDLERGLARARQMGLLGAGEPARDFPDRLGEFRLLRRLGSGGMGVVYEAQQESLDRRVALKVVRPELLWFEGARERFRREIEAVARLSHPAVVPVLASGEQDGVPWYAMELLTGLTLHAVVEALGDRDPSTLRGSDLRLLLGAGSDTGTDPFSGSWWQTCVRIVHAVALGVRHAHLRGIVHRDIKPSNVMLTTDGRTVLLDFGVARIGAGRDATRTGNTPGSPAFMSPEQLRGLAVDERTDVWSLAATLWQLLALRAPYPHQGADALRLRELPPPSVRAHHRDVPPELDVVLQKAMDPDRERRYADVEQFADDLLAVLQRRPIRARRLSPALRTFRWCQRHRVAATLLACGLVVALLLPGAFAWREREANRALAASTAAAEQSLDTTLEAIYGMIVRVSDDKLRHVPAADAVARDAMEDARRLYATLRTRHPDHERLRLDATRALSRLGALWARLGDQERAAAVLREAIGYGDGEPDALSDLLLEARAIARLNLANSQHHAGDTAAATAELARAESEITILGNRPAAAHKARVLAAQVTLERAYLLDPLLDPAAHEAHTRAALARYRECSAAAPADASLRTKVVSVLDTLATMLAKHQRYDEAETLLTEALALAEALPADAGLWPPASATVAEVQETLGNLYVDRRDRRGIDLLKDCLRRRERLAHDHPHDLALRCDHAAALHNLARMNVRQDQLDLALERLDQALELQRSVVAAAPSMQEARQYLRQHLMLRGSCLATLGRRAELDRTTDELCTMDHDPAALRTAARLRLRSAALLAAESPPPAGAEVRRQELLDGAMGLLLAAERRGWGPRNPLGEALYDPLRSRAEFTALQQRREAAETAARPEAR